MSSPQSTYVACRAESAMQLLAWAEDANSQTEFPVNTISRHHPLMELLWVLLTGFVALAGASCGKPTVCKLKFTTVTKNDLDMGMGGAIIYSDVCTVKGKAIDMVVTSNSGYTTKNGFRNGLSGKYGRINLDGRSGHDFQFTFYEAGSTTPTELESFYFTIFDIDGKWNKKGQMKVQESVTFSGFESYSVGANCELHRQISAKQSTFSASTTGYIYDNPEDPQKLTPQQMSRSVTFLYKSVASFSARFEVLGKGKLNRNFIFAGESQVSHSCTAPVCRPAGNCKLSFKDIMKNNLGGKGPQTGVASEIRYGSVCTVSGQGLDLAVTATSPYVPAKAKKNGINGAYGTVNLANQHKGDFLFSFYKKGSNDPFTLSSTSFTIFDIDSGKPGEEIVTASGFTSYTTGNKTELKVESSSSSLKLTSTTFGTEADNPKDPMALTPKQLARSVTFMYEEVSSFPLSFEITGGPAGKGRNLLFAGDSSLNEKCASSTSSISKLYEEVDEDFEVDVLEKNAGMVPLLLVALASGLTCFFVGFAVQRRRASANRHVKDVPLQDIE